MYDLGNRWFLINQLLTLDCICSIFVYDSLKKMVAVISRTTTSLKKDFKTKA